MNGATVVQAGGSAEQQPQAVAKVAAVDFEVLRARMMYVLTRADDLLAAKQALATESGFDVLSDFADEFEQLSHDLCVAVAAQSALKHVHDRLRNRAHAVIELCEMPWGLLSEHFGTNHFNGLAELLEGCEVPERWRQVFMPEPEEYPY